MDISSLTPDKQMKLQYWLDVIRQCGASGLTNRDWCEQHGISLKSYYYWLAKIRKLAIEDLPRKNHCTSTALSQARPVSVEPEFSEVSFLESTSSLTNASAVVRIGKMSVEISEHISDELLVSILKAMQSC